MSHFTPVAALQGGALIGTSALLCWVLLGRTAGISGIVAGAAQASGAERNWRLAFLAGLILAPLVFALAGGALPVPEVTRNPAMLVVAGLLVGFGTRMGGGCTSGHGVCGLARLSWRSVVATGTFMASAVATVFVTRHLLGL
jgi:uncharacterized membrane protein YedE/YeeE